MVKKMPRLFEKHSINPDDIKSLDDIVKLWNRLFGKNGSDKHMRDEVVDFCIAASSYKQAVHRACNSIRPNGKMHNHQSRVPTKVRMRFFEIIMKDKGIRAAKTFDELYDALEAVAPEGIGPVTLYDVATRMAGYMKLEVTSLYLHAGVRVGWCVLHGKRSPNVDRIPREQLPKPLQRLPTDEIEDCLCALKDYLKPWLKEEQHAQA